ncbi:MAG: GNAT family N-acetyltransferase [Pseudomonadota bacterium]
MRMTAPTLQTERLTLRHYTRADLAPWIAFLGTDHARYMGGPISEQDAWLHFHADIATWQTDGFGGWSVVLDGIYIGQVGLSHPPEYPELELGWFLLPEFQGQGFATEAALAARAYAYNEGRQTTLVSYIDQDNAASIAVAERLGAHPDPKAARPDPEDLVYRHPAPEALQ